MIIVKSKYDTNGEAPTYIRLMEGHNGIRLQLSTVLC